MSWFIGSISFVVDSRQVWHVSCTAICVRLPDSWVVMVVMNKSRFDGLLTDKFRIGAAAETDALMNAEILSLSRPAGAASQPQRQDPSSQTGRFEHTIPRHIWRN